jgi:hypothetical protein
MQNQINTTAITQFVQQMRSAELTNAKELKMPIQQARLLLLSLTEVLDKINQDYETLYNALKSSPDTEVISVSMDGGSFEDK